LGHIVEVNIEIEVIVYLCFVHFLVFLIRAKLAKFYSEVELVKQDMFSIVECAQYKKRANSKLNLPFYDIFEVQKHRL